MKYIRTKNGRIIDVEKFKKGFGFQSCIYEDIETIFWRDACKYPKRHKQGIKARTLKAADTIEELCDFEMHYDHNGEFVIRPIKHVEFSSLRKAVMENHFKDCKLAIKTDKGLIYIAYMNNEGVFKLL